MSARFKFFPEISGGNKTTTPSIINKYTGLGGWFAFLASDDTSTGEATGRWRPPNYHSSGLVVEIFKGFAVII